MHGDDARRHLIERDLLALTHQTATVRPHAFRRLLEGATFTEQPGSGPPQIVKGCPRQNDELGQLGAALAGSRKP